MQGQAEMFFKYNRVRLHADLMGGHEAVADIPFVEGSNVIITDNNTQGKSSIINALAIGLGFDNVAKGNVSALVNETIKVGENAVPVFGADIYLEIENAQGHKITIRRQLRPDISSVLFVHEGAISSWTGENLKELYVGQNSYIDTRGFHRYLCGFMGFPNIQVVSYDEEETRLYLEYIFAAIFIEQKKGWSDIMANSPFFRVKDPKKCTVAELLGMDYIKNNMQRGTLKVETEKLKSDYESNLKLLKQQLHSKHFQLKGLSEDISAAIWSPTVFRSIEGQEDHTLVEILAATKTRLNELESRYTPAVTDKKLQSRLANIANDVSSLISKRNELELASSIATSSINRFHVRVDILEGELKKNKEEQKIRNLLNREQWVVKKSCPACERPIDETLLSQVKSFPTMSIDENVKYITDQKEVVTQVLSIEVDKKSRIQTEVSLLSGEIDTLLTQQSEIQRSLATALPAEMMAQAREIAHLEREIDALEDLQRVALGAFERIKAIFDAYQAKAGLLAGIRTGLVNSDWSLLNKFQIVFKDYLKALGFNSYQIDSVIIDHDTFMPKVVVQSAEERRKVRAEVGSSASDWIRIIIAFTLALHTSSRNSPKNKHPKVSVFDEPAQQKMDRDDELKFYDLVAEVCKGGGQIIIAATDQDKKCARAPKS
jgi:hypothetical protein